MHHTHGPFLPWEEKRGLEDGHAERTDDEHLEVEAEHEGDDHEQREGGGNDAQKEPNSCIEHLKCIKINHFKIKKTQTDKLCKN